MDDRDEDGTAPPPAGLIDRSRDLAQRGALAVARTGGDNLALTLLAAGTAAAAISWLVARRRRAARRRGA